MKGKMIKIGLVVCLGLCLPAILLAQEKPTAAESKKVVDYFYQGIGQGAILMAHKLCTQVYEEGPLKYECQEEITGGQVQKDREVFLWMNYLVPTGDKAEIIFTAHSIPMAMTAVKLSPAPMVSTTSVCKPR